MKKTLIAVAAATALTTSAFAEITFGAWGCTILVPVANNGDATVAGQTQSWGGYGRAIGLDIMGQDAEGKAGFMMSYRNTTEAEAQTGDNAHFWIKPIDTVKVYAGKVEYNGLRGNACLPGWDIIRCSFEVGEDLLFKNYAATGALIVANPTEVLTVFAGVPLTADFAKGKKAEKAKLDDNSVTGVKAKVDADPTANNTDDDQASNVYKRTQVGFGYNIDCVGIVKAQFIGKNKKILIATNYDKDVLTSGDTIKPGMQSAAGVDYKLQDGLNFVGQVGYLAERKCGSAKINESSVSAMGGVNYACGAANVFAGFQMQTNVENDASGLQMKNTNADKKNTVGYPCCYLNGILISVAKNS